MKTIMIAIMMMQLFQPAIAQVRKYNNDPYLPGKHNFSAGLITTYRGSSIAAPVLIVDLTYGVSRRTSLGLVGGTTGTLTVIAGKLATSFLERDNFRMLYRMSIIYYPERDGTYLFDQSKQQVMPWMLTMGFLDAEWKTKSGIRWAIGAGLLETHCIDGMMSFLRGEFEEEEGELPFEWFTTIQSSVSLPLSKKFTLRPEVITVFQGTSLVSGDQHKVAPLNIYVNLVYNF